MKQITSTQNPKVKKLSKLMSSSSYRRESGEFVLEGLRLCLDALNSEYELCEVYATPDMLSRYAGEIAPLIQKSKQSYEISKDVCQKISDTKNAQGIFCLCKILDKQNDSYKIDTSGKYILLEQISDPTNFGAVCRTAEAMGISGVIVCGGCDIYSPKVMRCAMGSLLRIPVIFANDVQDFLNHCKNVGIKTYASTPCDDAQNILDVDMCGGVVFVIGNEAQGVTQSTMDACNSRVTIKMQGKAESLNAAAAASIIIWEMMK